MANLGMRRKATEEAVRLRAHMGYQSIPLLLRATMKQWRALLQCLFSE